MLLGALASEFRLAESALHSLRPSRVQAWRERGLILEAGTLISSRKPYVEQSFAVNAELRPLILRQLDTEQLSAARELGQAALGERSVAAFLTALYQGELQPLARAISGLKAKLLNDAESFARNHLREAVSEAFDGEWFARTWGGSALLLSEHVLRNGLWALDSTTDLYSWTLSRASTASLGTQRTLIEQALLRGDTLVLEALSSKLSAPERLALNAARSLVEGDLPHAQDLLDQSLSFFSERRALALGTGTVVALLVLLALAREGNAGRTLAKRLLRASVPEATSALPLPFSDAAKAASRALRALLRELCEPRNDRVLLSAHQLPPDAAAWEVLIGGLNAHLHVTAEVPRSAWGRRLAVSAERWKAAGYRWFAWQTARLARALGGAEIPAELAPDYTLALVDLLEREPEWRQSLQALAAFVSEAKQEKPVVSRRVAWFVDMVRGVLEKPLLEEFRENSGWAGGHRAEVAELIEIQSQLPPEDSAVLRVADRRRGALELGVGALQMLIGHPRVFNGARGRLPVDVARGTCRVETRHEAGYLVLRLEPAGLVEGINVVVESESRLLVYEASEGLAKLAALLPQGVRVPETHAQEALPILAQLADHVEIQGTELSALRRVEADSTPCVRISLEAGAFWLELGVRPFAKQGRFFSPGLGRAAVAAYEDGALFETRRNLEEEAARFKALVSACPSLARAFSESGEERGFSVSLGEEDLFAFLNELTASAVAVHLEWQKSSPIHGRGSLSGASLHGKLRRSKGWYLVTGGVRLNDVTDVALADLVSMPFTKTGRFIRLPSGDFIELERRISHALARLAAVAVPAGPGELKISDGAFEALEPLLQAGGALEIEPSARSWMKQVESERDREYPLPSTLNASLRPYQLEGYQWLRRSSELGLGVCLADDMGLGKTVQLLALLLARADAGPALVITPTSVARNWIEEIARFAPSLRAREYAGKDRTVVLNAVRERTREAPAIVVASYALLQQDADALSSIEWNTVVLDEAQFIKNARSQRAQAAARLRADYRVVLTGTPVENHLGDLWSIFHFLNPTLLGTFKQFQVRYLAPIERDGNPERRQALKNLLRPFILRRTKPQVLSELPPLTVVNHAVRLSDDEAMRYALLRRQIHDKLYTAHGKRERKLEIFAEIMRLRRFCCHPRLVFPDAALESAKLQSFLELLEELRQNDHRALVFSQFVDFLDLVRQELEERGIRYLYLDGSTPREARHQRVTAFQAGEAELFLISLKAGGFGLNLTAADYVIHLDPWWNPAVEAQATDRAHRIGQERPVTVYRLVTKDTIEERILELHREKRALADALLEGSDLALSMSVEEIESLLTQPLLG